MEKNRDVLFKASLRTTEMKGGRGNGAAAAAEHCWADFQPSHPGSTGSALKAHFACPGWIWLLGHRTVPTELPKDLLWAAPGPEMPILWLQPGQAPPPAPLLDPSPLEMGDEGWHKARGACGAPQDCASSLLPMRTNPRTHEGSRNSTQAPALLQGQIPW